MEKSWVTKTNGNVEADGTVTATSFSGSGANLTSLPAGNLTGTLPAISGANLTNLPGGGGEISISTTGSPSVGDRMGVNSSGQAVPIGSVISANNPPTGKYEDNHYFGVTPSYDTVQIVYMPNFDVYVCFAGSGSSGKLNCFKYTAGGGFQWNSTSQNYGCTYASNSYVSMCRMNDTSILMVQFGASGRIEPFRIDIVADSGETAGAKIGGQSQVNHINTNAHAFSNSGGTNYYDYWTADNSQGSIGRISETNYVIYWQGTAAQVAGITFNGTLTKYTTPSSFTTVSSQSGIGQSTVLTQVGTSSVFVGAMEGDTRCKVRAISVSGTSVSMGSPITLDESGTGNGYQWITYDSMANRVMVSWCTTTGSSGTRKIALLSVSGTSLTQQGSNHTLLSGSQAYSRGCACFIGNIGRTFLNIYGGQGGSNDMQVVKVNSSSITEYAEGNGFSSSNPNLNRADGSNEYMAAAQKYDANSGHVLRIFTYGSNRVYFTSHDCGTGTPGKEGYIGCYKSSGKVYVSGGVATGLSGLTAGTRYFLDDVGNLSTTGSVVAGVALSSTTMLVK